MSTFAALSLIGSRSEDGIWTRMQNKSLVVGWRKRWNRSLLQFLGRRVRATVDVEDLAQETYLRLLRARDLSVVRNPQAYLLRVAGHVVTEWRHHQPKSESMVTLDDELLIDACLPEFVLDAALSQDRLDAMLLSVSPMMRAVLLLRLRDDRPYRDIANELGITDRQVKRHLARGYERLRDVLES
jgi:RNA polymerase sigma-70 factor (ECF subfamily)